MALLPLSVLFMFTERDDVDYGAYHSPHVSFVALQLLLFEPKGWTVEARPSWLL